MRLGAARGTALAVSLWALGTAGPWFASTAVGQRSTDRFSFVVVGHLRGRNDEEVHPRLDEFLAKVRALRPDAIFLTGDLIWGSVARPMTDRKVIEAQWRRFDERLAVLGIPVYRVPGNHDIHDPVSRDVFFERYGQFPRTVVLKGVRFLLLNTTFTPIGSDSIPAWMKPTKTRRLDTAQVRFLRDGLAASPSFPAFVMMHHVLWFGDDDPWWSEVHPLLAKTGVRAVFSGDLGPSMYTHMTRDTVEYFRSILNAAVDNPLEDKGPSGLIRTVQFENFLFVQVDGSQVSYSLETVGGISSGAFAPARWREAFGPEPDPGRYYDPLTYRPRPRPSPSPPSLMSRVRRLAGSPGRMAAVVGLGGLVFLAGVGVGARRRRPAPTTLG